MRKKTILSVMLICMLAFSATGVSAQQPGGKKYVIFRDDDVGLAPDLLPTLKAVNEAHADEHVPVTLAIVPNPSGSNVEREAEDAGGTLFMHAGPSTVQHRELFGSTSVRVYLASLAGNHLFEFAQHGYTHQHTPTSSTSEFGGVPYSLQRDAIQQGKDDMWRAFGVTPHTFVPPWNSGDQNTLEAIKALGFTDYCTGRANYATLYGSTVPGVRVEAHNTTLAGANFTQLNESFRAARAATEQFLNDPQSETFIVSYHFWSFSNPDSSVDSKGVQLLRDYMTELKSHGVLFTRLDRTYTTTGESAIRGEQIVATSDARVAANASAVWPAIPPAYALLFSGICIFAGLCWMTFIRPLKPQRPNG